MPRFDLIEMHGHELFLSDAGCHRRLSKALQTSIGAYATSGRGKYRFLLNSLLNHELEPGEPDDAFLTESWERGRERIVDWAETVLRLTLRPGPNVYQDGTWEVLRDGPVNHYAKGFAAARAFHRELVRLGLRSGQNPAEQTGWHLKSREEKFEECVRRYGIDMAPFVMKYAGGQFICHARDVYPPCLDDPLLVPDAMAKAVEDMFGEGPITDFTRVLRDDGQRPMDIAQADGADWAYSDFGQLFGARNKGDGDDRVKRGGIADDTLAAMHARIDAEHAADPSRPNMAQLRLWKATGDIDALRGFKLFHKIDSLDAYSYWGLRYHMDKAMAEGDVYRDPERKRHATMMVPRRAIMESEVLSNHRRARTPEERELLNDDLRRERHHRTDQSSRYAAHALAVIEEDVKTDRMKRHADRRSGKATEEPVAPPQTMTDVAWGASRSRRA